ncbi:MAG: hypothetical protein WCB05_20810 [Candidatus Sulfotelmatobacter sp.]
MASASVCQSVPVPAPVVFLVPTSSELERDSGAAPTCNSEIAVWLDKLSFRVGSGIRHELVDGKLVSIEPENIRKPRYRRRSIKDIRTLNSEATRSAERKERVERRRRNSLFLQLIPDPHRA